MFTMIRNAFMSLLLFTILTGLIYPLAVTGIAQAIFPHQANGSIIMKDGKPIGSALLGQQFDDQEILREGFPQQGLIRTMAARRQDRTAGQTIRPFEISAGKVALKAADAR
jgi:K+-transporting ATPase c subunit